MIGIKNLPLRPLPLRMNKQEVRLGSFKSWEPSDHIHPIMLAESGLFSAGSGDSLQCYSCSVVMTSWREKGIDPIQLHRDKTPNCPHLRGVDSSNIPIWDPDLSTCARVDETLRQKYLALRSLRSDANHMATLSLGETHSDGSIGSEQRFELIWGSEEEVLSSNNHVNTRTTNDDLLLQPMLEVPDATASHSQPFRPNGTQEIDWDQCKASTEERLKTFEHWPISAQAHPAELAEAGFVYTGSQDRVQCVYCEGFLRNWQSGDVPAVEHMRYFPTCPIVISSSRPASDARIDAVSNPPTVDLTHNINGNTLSPRSLPPTVSQDVSIPDSENAIASGFDNVPNQIVTSTPPEVSRRERRNGPLLSSGHLASGSLMVSGQELTGIVTERPKHQQMAIEAARIASFKNWPSGKCQTPQQLSKAGFFYAGFNDSVKCFFCDGGLRNWEREDDPWHEHARWFPSCKYVRQVKGDSFVEEVLTQEGGKIQQTAVYETGRNVSSESVDRVTVSGGVGGEARHAAYVEPREITARMDSPLVRAVLNMDVPQELVRRAIEQRLSTLGDDFPSMEALLETVFELTTQRNQLAGGDAPRSLIEENRQLKEQRTCKICMDEEVCVVFVPCGHLVCCATCAPPLSKCPICRSTIRGTVRTYMS